MSDAAAKTGIGPMFMIAVEQTFPPAQRVVEDPLAYRILPPSLRAFAWLLKPAWARDWMVRATDDSLPGMWGWMMCRKRYIDDRLAEDAPAMGAVLNLGAGFDTRALRLPALAGVPVWEVDQEQNIRQKEARLRAAGLTPPPGLTLLAVDFDRERLDEALAKAGLDLGRPQFCIWEGVTQYLTEAAVHQTLQLLSGAASGSRLAFTYVLKDFLEGTALYGQEALREKYVVKERAWLYGIAPDDVAGLLDGYGWDVLEHVGAEELSQRYVAPTGRPLATTPIERMVYAGKR
ncbi:MAG: SAM-dependent methyltransferase [Alphaproteobacteria bacterium]|nr:SAM-dependent methyltransferase [Alphaproteobacteria bacterium]